MDKKIIEKVEKIQKKISDIFNIKFKFFQDTFLYNFRIIKGETIKSPLKINYCNSFRIIFSKKLYNRLFTYLVKKMNYTLFDEKIKELQNLYVEDISKEIENIFIKEGLHR